MAAGGRGAELLTANNLHLSIHNVESFHFSVTASRLSGWSVVLLVQSSRIPLAGWIFLQSASRQKYLILSAGLFVGRPLCVRGELEAAGLGVGAGGAVAVGSVPANTQSVTWEKQGGGIKR